MKRSSTILAISGGKGGIGKSVIAVNLAEVLAGQGYRAALLDVDMDQGACSILTNEQPPASVLALAQGRASDDDVLHTTTRGLTLVESVSEITARRTHDVRLYDTLDRLVARLSYEHDYVIIDTPAGVDEPVRWALDTADISVLVLVAEPTAIASAYRQAKLVWSLDPDYPLGTVVNAADTDEEAQSIADRFAHITEHFVDHAPSYMGWIPYASEIRRSVRDQRPVVLTPGTPCSAFVDVARCLTEGRLLTSHPAHAEVSL